MVISTEDDIEGGGIKLNTIGAYIIEEIRDQGSNHAINQKVKDTTTKKKLGIKKELHKDW